jgi:hypothetical protein
VAFEREEFDDDFDPDEVPSDEELDIEGPNEGATGDNPEDEFEELDGDDVI